MTFIRPELRETLWRWREVIAYAALVLFGVYLIGRSGGPLLIGLGIALAAIFTVQLVTAVLRLKLQKPIKATGVVEVKEREVGYLAPDGGAFVSLDDLTKLEIVTTDKGPVQDDVFWVLTHLAGDPLLIPASAQGSDQLFDAFAALKGIDFETAVHAMSSTENARFLIWERRVLH